MTDNCYNNNNNKKALKKREKKAILNDMSQEQTS